MQYNGINIKEADGKYYPLSPTPKKMLVWDGPPISPIEMEVLGFFQGRWVAAKNEGTGVTQWRHAAEIPTPTLRPFNNAKELDNAIAKHGSWVLSVGSGIRYLITSYGNNSVKLDGDGHTIVTVMREFTFLDGAPFGVVEAQ